jgi:hypothetical protein
MIVYYGGRLLLQRRKKQKDGTKYCNSISAQDEMKEKKKEKEALSR